MVQKALKKIIHELVSECLAEVGLFIVDGFSALLAALIFFIAYISIGYFQTFDRSVGLQLTAISIIYGPEDLTIEN